MKKKIVALAGNPNVGKSTVFNALTGMKQHTGNWSGKTVSNATGQMQYKDIIFQFVDLPGAYSLSSASPDEKVTGDYISSNQADIVLIIADATCLERNLLLVKEVLLAAKKALVCINLMDEAKKKGISVNIKKLQSILNVPVIPASARSKEGLPLLIDRLYELACENSLESDTPPKPHERKQLPSEADIYKECVSLSSEEPHSFDRKIDRIVTSKKFGFPIMILMLLLIFWITMIGANYPSAALSSMFAVIEGKIELFLTSISCPSFIVSFIVDGIYKTTAWVVSVMLPPMAIFFPLFTLLEDFGYLPRVAFNLDSAFKNCGAHGKQSLTMWLAHNSMRNRKSADNCTK